MNNLVDNNYIINKLYLLLNDISNRNKNYLELDKYVNNHYENFENQETRNILSDLVLDLDNYEPNENLRCESVSYFGDERLEELVKEALEKLDAIVKK